MSIFGGNLTLVAVSLLVGWVALWPCRRLLGAWGYHLAAFPIGLLAWPVGAALAEVTGGLYQLSIAMLAAFLVALVGSLVCWYLGGDDGDARVATWTWFAHGGAVLGLAAVVSAAGYSILGYDSVFHYEAWGLWLFDTGRLTTLIAGAYGMFLPSLHAANRAFGGDWTYVVYPIMAAHLIALLAYGLARTLPHSISRAWRVVIVTASLVLLATTSPFLFHSLNVHSHMASALFFTLALLGVHEAFLGAGRTADKTALAWSTVAGLALGGFALVRTDGLAYAVVVLALAAVLNMRDPSRRRLIGLHGGLYAMIAIAYGAAFIGLGVWHERKMSGKMAGAVIVATLVFAAASYAGPWFSRWFKGRQALLLTVVGLNLMAIAGAYLLRPAGFAVAVPNMVGNLASAGGYGLLWYFIAGSALVTLVLRRGWVDHEWTDYALYAFFQFFAIALIVHGLTHEGRLSPADSFSRLAFHAVPLFFWYLGTVAGGLVQTLSIPRSTR